MAASGVLSAGPQRQVHELCLSCCCLSRLREQHSGRPTLRGEAETIAESQSLFDLGSRAEISSRSCVSHEFITTAVFVNSASIGHPDGSRCSSSWKGKFLAAVGCVGVCVPVHWTGSGYELPPWQVQAHSHCVPGACLQQI